MPLEICKERHCHWIKGLSNCELLHTRSNFTLINIMHCPADLHVDKYKILQILYDYFISLRFLVASIAAELRDARGEQLLTDQNDIYDEMKSRLNSGNACYYSIQNLLSSRLISKNLKIKIYKTVILPVCSMGATLGLSR
jgi:hypothetical protein